jgi:hypothetical protein
MEQQGFFNEELYDQKEQIDDRTEITQVLLYYESEEAKEFKRLCKIGIQKEFPGTFIEKGNISDFLLKVLKKYYGTTINT